MAHVKRKKPVKININRKKQDADETWLQRGETVVEFIDRCEVHANLAFKYNNMSHSPSTRSLRTRLPSRFTGKMADASQRRRFGRRAG